MGLNAFKIILSIKGFFSTNIYMSFCLIWKHNIDNAINKQMLQEVQKTILSSRMCNSISFYSQDLKIGHDNLAVNN